MLTIPIWVNNHEVGRVELIRIDPLTRPAEGQVCTYSMRYYNGSLKAAVQKTIQFPYVTGNPVPLATYALQEVDVSLDRTPVVR